LEVGHQLLQKSEKWVGGKDPVYSKLKKAIKTCRRACNDIRRYVERGRAIEEIQE
jgi:hypothetical protein